VTVCVGLDLPRLLVMDPRTLEVLGALDLPPRALGPGDGLTNFTGGGYFFLDDRDRAVVPTATRHLVVVRVGSSGTCVTDDGKVPMAADLSMGSHDLTSVGNLNGTAVSSLVHATGASVSGNLPKYNETEKMYYDNNGELLYQFTYDATGNCIYIENIRDYQNDILPADVGVDPLVAFSWMDYSYYHFAYPSVPTGPV